MGHSIEGRFPFLDYRVAEFAARLPDSERLHGLHEKRVLRTAVSPLLPPEIVNRKKQPYRAPIVQAFVGPGAPGYVGELLEPAHLDDVGLFKADAVSALVRKCAAAGEAGVGETDEMALVGVVSTMLLHDRLVAEPALAPPAVPTRVVIGSAVQPSAGEPSAETAESLA
jgi:asparagine synthase (glutamine-hydrolysing)